MLRVGETPVTTAFVLPIERAHPATGRWLDRGGPDLPAPEHFVSLHHRDVPVPAPAEAPPAQRSA